MIRNEAYWDFAMAVRNKVKSEVNGIVKFEIYENINTIIFKIYFKEFNFSFGIDDVSDAIYHGTTDEIVEKILGCYKKTILNSFFKSDDRKRRDERKRLGIEDEEVYA